MSYIKVYFYGAAFYTRARMLETILCLRIKYFPFRKFSALVRIFLKINVDALNSNNISLIEYTIS